MRNFKIINENTGSECTNIKASHERSALKKYRKGMMSSGIYDIVDEKDGRPRLVTSYGGCFRADPIG